MTTSPSGLIADDEPLLRDVLKRLLADLWPEFVIVAQARNGREAIEMFERFRPEVCFLDIHMPGLTGIDAAQRIGSRAHLVFVTAFDHYAVQAFVHGALDYLVKPVEPARLGETVSRLKLRLQSAQPASNTEALPERLTVHMQRLSNPTPAPLRWIRAQLGHTVRLINVDDVDYLRSDKKYTVVAWRAEDGRPAEALIRTALRDLVGQLEANHFVQIHRSFAVNLRSISYVRRDDIDTGVIHLKGRRDILPISRSYLHLFRQM